MRRRTSAFVTAGFAAVLGILGVPHAPSAQARVDQLFPPYNPYPPGILPPDLDSEIARVRREIQSIFNEALNDWRALPPSTTVGNPPTLRGSGYAAIEILGKLMNFDENMSPFRNEACATCHMPYTGFSGPIPSVNLTMIAYPGSFRYRAGKRVAQRYTYSPDFPVLEYNTTLGAFFGGNFWDARSTGYKLQSADAEQAQHPPVDTQEMGFPDTACIAFRLSKAVYRPLFELVWGADFHIRWPGNTEKICSTPGGAASFGGSATPIWLSPEDRTKANNIYDHWGQSISKYERSNRLSPFTSKFDAFLSEKYTLTSDEMAGYNLFKGKANCKSCQLDGRSTTLTRDRLTPAPRPLRSLCSPASAMPISVYRSTLGLRFIIRPRRTASDLRPIPTASGTEIWDWAPFSGARPIRTRNGYNLPQPPTASCRHRRRATWRWHRHSVPPLRRPGPIFRKSSFTMATLRASSSSSISTILVMCFHLKSVRDTVRRGRRKRWIAGRCPRFRTTLT